jgi:RimJ/RimL family protein N-acetyltransferase
MEKIETARLVLRRPIASDLEPLVSINADPEVMRYIGDGRTPSRAQGFDRVPTTPRLAEVFAASMMRGLLQTRLHGARPSTPGTR